MNCEGIFRQKRHYCESPQARNTNNKAVYFGKVEACESYLHPTSALCLIGDQHKPLRLRLRWGSFSVPSMRSSGMLALSSSGCFSNLRSIGSVHREILG